MIKSVFHVNINVTDFDRSLAFYKMVGFKVVLDIGEGPNEGNDVGLNIPNSIARAALLSLSDDPRATRIDLIEWKKPRTEGAAPAHLYHTGIARIALFTKNIDEEYQRLKAAGVVRAYGASVDWAADIDLVTDTTGSQVLEVLLHAFHQEPLPALEKAATKGVGVIVKVPLDSGWLAGRYGKDASFSDVRSRWSRADIERRAALVEQFKELLPDAASMPHTALRWLLAQRSVTSVIPGAKSVAQLKDNVAAATETIPAETARAIESLWAKKIEGSPLPW